MKKLFTILIIIALAFGIFAMRQYNIEYMNELIRSGIQRPILGVDALYTGPVVLGDKVAVYKWSQVFLDFDPLEYNIPIEGNEGVFRSPKNADLINLVYRDGYKSYGLEFHSFNEPYEYKDVLELICNVHSADDIVSIKYSASYRKNAPSDEITDRTAISDVYNALCSMSSDDAELEYMHTGERYLILTLKGGTTIDWLKYSTRDGRFFRNGSVVYSQLDADTRQRMKEIFR